MISIPHGISLKTLQTLPIFKDAKIKLAKVADIDENASLRFCNMTGIKESTTDPMDIINDDSINVVYILTPTKYHKELFISASEQGKHIFCEKPLAFSISDIKEMIQAKEKNNILAQIGLVLRHCPIYWYIKKIVEDQKDDLGDLLTIVYRDDQEWPIAGSSHFSDWRRDRAIAYAGCLFEHSIHDVDILEYLFGQMKNLFARVRYFSPESKVGLEDLSVLNFEFLNNGTGSLTSIWHKIKRDFRHLEIFFENGSIIMEDYTGQSFKSFKIQIGKQKKPTELSWKEIEKEYLAYKNLSEFKISFLSMYLYENFHFIKSLIEENEENPPYPSLEIGLRAHEIVEAAYKSSKSQKIVSLI